MVENTTEVETASEYTGRNNQEEDTEGIAKAHALKPPAKNAPAHQHKVWLDHQLDTLANKILLRQFVIAPLHQRRYGGVYISVPIGMQFAATHIVRLCVFHVELSAL